MNKGIDLFIMFLEFLLMLGLWIGFILGLIWDDFKIWISFWILLIVTELSYCFEKYLKIAYINCDYCGI